MARGTGQPNLSFKDGMLFLPGYSFRETRPWLDVGSLTMLAEGSNLKDGSDVLAKIAPARSDASTALEREAHVLHRLTGSAESSITLRLLEHVVIPPEDGDSIVLVVGHPGANQLGRYFTEASSKSLLLSSSDPKDESISAPFDDNIIMEDGDSMLMDLATFIEFAIQATHCLEAVHRMGFVHREVRLNAFHMNTQSGSVRLVHFGNRAISLEQLGGPSSFVVQADNQEGPERDQLRDAMCYLAPEQTGSYDSTTEDHRTDLYALGIVFWITLVGGTALPFDAGPLELLQAITQNRPRPVHEIRRDIPQIVSAIIEKLLSKQQESRYNSAAGLQADLVECQKRLSVAVCSLSDEENELIPYFNIGENDKFMEFTIPSALFGREKEMEVMRSVILQSSSYHGHLLGTNKGSVSISVSSSSTQGVNAAVQHDDNSESATSHSDPSQSSRPVLNLNGTEDNSKSNNTRNNNISSSDDRNGSPRSPTPSTNNSQSGDSYWRTALNGGKQSTKKIARTHTIVVTGPAGIGKSAFISAHQSRWRAHGLWGQSKFVDKQSLPFIGILTCLSSVLRQLMTTPTDVHVFVKALRARLGPQLRNAPLLYTGAPELRDVLNLYELSPQPLQEPLTVHELRARFQLLVEAVFAVLAEIKLLALFLDDIQFADEWSLDMLSTLAQAKGRLLLLVSLRSEDADAVQRMTQMFQSRSRTTWISLEPLNHSAVSALVTKTLHRSKDECAPLSRLCHRVSKGNPFTIRNLLFTFRRQNHIYFDSNSNSWRFNMEGIERSLSRYIDALGANTNSYLLQHLRELPEEAINFITWGSMLGSSFRVAEALAVIDWGDASGDASGDDSDHTDVWDTQSALKAKGSMKGLHAATAEGWLYQRSRERCSFVHDRFFHAAVGYRQSLPKQTQDKMALRIAMMLLRDCPAEVLRIAEHCKSCIPTLHKHPEKEKFLSCVLEAAENASARGAHENALDFFLTAQALNDAWADYTKTMNLHLRIAELLSWKGDAAKSIEILEETYSRALLPEDRAQCLRIQSQNQFVLRDFSASLRHILSALQELGINIDANVSRKEADTLFHAVKNQILQRGFDSILAIPKTTDKRARLVVQLLGDASTATYWDKGEGFEDVIGLTTIQESLRCGMCPGSALGFFWVLSASAEKRELYRFSMDLGKLGLRIAEMHGTTADQCKGHLLYIVMIAAYENVHLRSQIGRLELARQLADSAGDRIYASFAVCHRIAYKTFVCEHLSELLPQAEEASSDINSWFTGSNDLPLCMAGLLAYIRAIAGNSISTAANNAFDCPRFNESEYLEAVRSKAGNYVLTMNWYLSFKMAGLYTLGWFKEAAEIGFEVYEHRQCHPNHRHSRYGLFFHSLALIQCLRSFDFELSHPDRIRYREQVELNQQFLRRWLSPSPINNATWIAIVDAEWAALCNRPDAFKLYDVAVTLAINHDWLLEEGLALYLQGSHFIRNGIESLGAELQRRGIAREAQWGAMGIVKSLSANSRQSEPRILKRNIFTAEVAVQTDSVFTSMAPHEDETNKEATDDFDNLAAEDLAAILRWNRAIAGDINLSSALQRLTEIAADSSKAQFCSLALRTDDGDFTVATSLLAGSACQVFENPRSIRDISDPLRKLAIQNSIERKCQIYLPDASQDPDYSSATARSSDRSVICVPIVANRSHLQGLLYLGGTYSFQPNDVVLLNHLAQQASVSIANALLFKSVQQQTKANLKMISSQRSALEDARRSREEALKATKIKSNFLASMSHELRTPFSSFYGLLDLLGGTSLNQGQHEIVQTAKQSCELLLKIIDSILDYSKLEAEALKIEVAPFPLEDVIADCMELLLPMAVKKLDMSYNIEPNVPRWVIADYARIRQVLMNLLGNGLKFTSEGFVQATCSLDPSFECKPGAVALRITIRDSGIGLSPNERESLFVPFQQADNSSTRRFGGTGLGLSISRELIKLMNGVIDVESKAAVGSSFWFTIPVEVYESIEAKKEEVSLSHLRTQLRGVKIVVTSFAETTSALLRTMLSGLNVTVVSSISSVVDILSSPSTPPFDFIIIDHQSEGQVDEVVRQLERMPEQSECKIIHLYTPTSSSLSSGPLWATASPKVIRSHKPPRTLRLLQLLASLKGISTDIASNKSSDVAEALKDLSAAKRTLYGNVLIAEDNPVAQQLLVKQLQRHQLNVIPTSNGEEAVAEWEAHEPGYFSIALFDHHMPVCDGVEACKRIRTLEIRRKVAQQLPIVALSADCQPSVQQLCLSAGMSHFLTKPLKKADLLALLSMFGDPS